MSCPPTPSSSPAAYIPHRQTLSARPFLYLAGYKRLVLVCQTVQILAVRLGKRQHYPHPLHLGIRKPALFYKIGTRLLEPRVIPRVVHDPHHIRFGIPYVKSRFTFISHRILSLSIIKRRAAAIAAAVSLNLKLIIENAKSLFYRIFSFSQMHHSNSILLCPA